MLVAVIFSELVTVENIYESYYDNLKEIKVRV